MEDKAITGNPADVLEKLYQQHAGAVLAFCLRRTDSETAKDVLSNTFLVAWRRIEVIPDDPLPWLFTVSRNILRTSDRSARRRQALEGRVRTSEIKYAEDFTLEVNTRMAITRALERLSQSDREILMLSAWERMSSRQIAKVLGCSEPALRVRLSRARRRLVEMMKEPEVEAAGSRRAREAT